jgi:RNA polymerase sigma-70 factor (ECF subfamily)
VLRRHYDRIAAICHRLAGPVEGPDATQDALIAIARGLPGFDGRSSFRTWSYRVAVNATYDELRRRRRRPTDPLPEHREPVQPGPGVDTVVADRNDLTAALAQIPEEFRAAVVLRDLHDLDYAEIAEVLGIPPGTVRSRISRGRAALLRQLGGNPRSARERPTTRP